jgi:hypothetical protein
VIVKVVVTVTIYALFMWDIYFQVTVSLWLNDSSRASQDILSILRLRKVK